jgi:methylated-DNA-[protein]-cysteine S-methyltransferase
MSRSLVWKQMDSPIGALVLCRTEKGICHIEFGPFADREPVLASWADKWWKGAESRAWAMDDGCPVLTRTADRLTAYFTGDHVSFDEVPLDIQGTPFQKRVWQALLAIPYGKVCSYKAIAQAIGQPLAVRAVGGANNRNPIPIIVPCHRVIGADGSMVGYGGGLSIKTHLLTLEQPEGRSAAGNH